MYNYDQQAAAYLQRIGASASDDAGVTLAERLPVAGPERQRVLQEQAKHDVVRIASSSRQDSLLAEMATALRQVQQELADIKRGRQSAVARGDQQSAYLADLTIDRLQVRLLDMALQLCMSV